MSKPRELNATVPKRTNKRPTSQDVADLAGVSVTTVSFVINDKSGGNVRISDETLNKVWRAVKALNYRPSSAAPGRFAPNALTY